MVCREEKEKMSLHKTAILVAILCTCTTLYAQQRKDALVNYGVKVGFSSTIYDIMQLSVSSTPINEYNTKSEISSFFTAFTRFNIKRHYVQTEVSYNISNYSISMPTVQWDPQANENALSVIGTQINGIEVPLYYGYHIMKQGSYGMSFYLGPKAKFVLNELSRYTFSNLPYDNIKESIRPINYSLMFGLGINISRVFFDFSLEYGLHNISRGITTTDNEGNITNGNIIFDRRKNVLSFSVGFML